jgi:hypothetical protein
MRNSPSVNLVGKRALGRANRFGSAAGLGKLTILVFGTILAAACFVAFNVFPFYYYYFELVNQMHSAARVASTNTDQELRQKLLYHIKKMELPVEPGDLKITREGQVIRMALPYHEIFYVTWQGKDYDIWRFDFKAEVVEKY